MSSGDRMRGERYQNAIVLLLAVLVFASIPLIVNLAGIWFLWAPLLAALAVLPSALLRVTDLAAGLQGPSQVGDALAAGLRQAGVAVVAEAGSVVGRLVATSAVPFRSAHRGPRRARGMGSAHLRGVRGRARGGRWPFPGPAASVRSEARSLSHLERAPDSVVRWRARCLPRIGSHPRQAPSNSSPRPPCK